MAKKGKQEQVRRKGHVARNIGLAVLVLFIIGGVYFYYSFLSGGEISLAQVAASNPSALGNVILQKVNSYPQITMNYTGSITNSTVDPAFKVWYSKYGNYASFYLLIPSEQNTGNIYAVVGKTQNGFNSMSVCVERNVANGTRCFSPSGSTPEAMLYSISADADAELNVTGINGIHLTSTPTPSYYNGMPCFRISGAGTIGNIRTPYFNASEANLTFTGCFSSELYVPLILNATIASSSGTIEHINTAATSVLMSSSKAYVDSLANSTT